MAVAFAIKDRCGFNLTAPEETILLDSYLQVRDSISTHPAVKIFEDLFVNGSKGVDEAAIIAINEAVKIAEMPVQHRMYPKPTDWTDYCRMRDDRKYAIRQHIMAKLGQAAERSRLIEAARREYLDLPPFYPPEDPGYSEMFLDALDRIKHGAYVKRKVYAPETPQPIVNLEPVRPPQAASLALAAPRPERLAMNQLSLLPAAARVAQAAQALSLHRIDQRQITEQITELQRRLAELGETEDSLNATLAQALKDL